MWKRTPHLMQQHKTPNTDKKLQHFTIFVQQSGQSLKKKKNNNDDKRAITTTRQILPPNVYSP